MKSLILFLSLTVLNIACASTSKQLPTVESVEVERYVGKWNAIFALPQTFTKSCIAQTAEYEIIASDAVSVLNTCLKEHGKTKTIKGKAVVKNKTTNASLIVTFDNFWTKLFRVKGDYQILKLDENYEYALVGSNNLKSLWLLARDTEVSKEVIAEYLAAAKALGFDTSKVIFSKFE